MCVCGTLPARIRACSVLVVVSRDIKENSNVNDDLYCWREIKSLSYCDSYDESYDDLCGGGFRKISQDIDGEDDLLGMGFKISSRQDEGRFVHAHVLRDLAFPCSPHRLLVL